MLCHLLQNVIMPKDVSENFNLFLRLNGDVNVPIPFDVALQLQQPCMLFVANFDLESENASCSRGLLLAFIRRYFKR